jgi:hypothetical protein
MEIAGMSWCTRKFRGDRLASIAAIAIFAAGSANAADTVAQTSAKPAARPPTHSRVGGSLEHRVDVLAKALQLDARQRTELLTILESQRETVRKIWSDPALLPAERTPATRAVQERTADQIRAILSAEQKKRYNPPKPQGAEPPLPDVEDWMRKQSQTQARQQQ